MGPRAKAEASDNTCYQAVNGWPTLRDSDGPATRRFQLDTIYSMPIKCPKCGEIAKIPHDTKLVVLLAERGKLKPFCSSCDFSWSPSLEEQQAIANNLRNQ